MMRLSCDTRRSRHKPSRVAPAGRAPLAFPWPCRGSAKIRQLPAPLPSLAPLMVANTAVICVNRSLITPDQVPSPAGDQADTPERKLSHDGETQQLRWRSDELRAG